MGHLAEHAEMQVRISGRVKLNEKEFCKIVPKRNPVFYQAVLELGKTLEQAQKTEDDGERRKLLPTRLETNYLKKIVKGFIVLRGRLSAKERRMAAKIGCLERQAMRAYERGLRSIK